MMAKEMRQPDGKLPRFPEDTAKSRLLGLGRVVDEGEAVGNAPSGHVVPA